MKAMADKSCTLRCATNKVHMRAPAREPPQDRANRSCPITRNICIRPASSSSMHTPLKLVLQSPKQSASFYGHTARTVWSYQTCRKPALRVIEMDPRTHADEENRDISSSTALPHFTYPVLGKLDRHQITISGASVAMCKLKLSCHGLHGDLLLLFSVQKTNVGF